MILAIIVNKVLVVLKITVIFYTLWLNVIKKFHTHKENTCKYKKYNST